ncbi:hypothetical protein ACH4Y0_18260 [Streptomyces sp. NPDC020707]|uniref:hypothetical protein n=1 Tax=Streptomyces sp. NPDC020707 TaxID=3365084 RepID=UPI0037ADCCC7
MRGTLTCLYDGVGLPSGGVGLVGGLGLLGDEVGLPEGLPEGLSEGLSRGGACSLSLWPQAASAPTRLAVPSPATKVRRDIAPAVPDVLAMRHFLSPRPGPADGAPPTGA